MRTIFLFKLLWWGYTFFIMPCYAQKLQVVTEEFPPYNYLENGRVVGLSTEVVRTVFSELNLEMEIQVLPWARAYQKAQTAPNTLIYTIGKTPERETLFQWVGVIAPSKSYLFALKNRDDIELNLLNDAKRFRVGAVRRSIRSQYLLKEGFTMGENLEINTSYKANFLMLYNNRIDLWAMNEFTAYFIVKQAGYNPQSLLKKAFFLKPLSETEYHMAFSPQTPTTLVQQFREALAKVKTQAFYQQIQNKYKQ